MEGAWCNFFWILPGEKGPYCKFFFCCLRNCFDNQFENASNLTLLSFKVPSERFFTRFSKQVLFFEQCGFENCKIESKVANISVGHYV